jgi:hypothetical protein
MRDAVVIKNSRTKALISEVMFRSPERTPVGVASVMDSTGYPAVAVLLMKPNGQGIVQLRDALTGAWIHQIDFSGSVWEVQAITSPDADRDDVPEVAVPGNSDDGTRSAIRVEDAATREPVNGIELPVESTTFQPFEPAGRLARVSPSRRSTGRSWLPPTHSSG